MSISNQAYRGIDNPLAVAKEITPDFIIRFDPMNEPAPTGGAQEFVSGTDADVIQAIQRLVESGRTTPSRVQVYANMRPVVCVTVQFAPQPPARSY